MRRFYPLVTALAFAYGPLGCGSPAAPMTDGTGTDTDAGPGTEGDGENDGPGEDGPADVTYVDNACLVHADCSDDHHCELGACVASCSDDDDCARGEVCSPRRRCAIPDTEPTPSLPAGDGSQLAAARTPLEDGEATNILQNSTDRPLRYRLSADTDAITVDTSIHTLAAGEAAVVDAAVDTAMLPVDQAAVAVTVHSGEGTLPWLIDLPRQFSGHYSGTVTFSEGAPRSDLSIGLNLAFDDDTGVVTGQTFADESLQWPRDLEVHGTWDPDTSEAVVELVDVLPAAARGVTDAPVNPLQRDVGRRIVLTGTLADDGSFTGSLREELSGLLDVLTVVEGAFGLRLDAHAREASGTATDFFAQGAVYVPAWEFPPGLDDDECQELANEYGTAATLPAGSPVADCTSCGSGFDCSAAEASACADALLDAGSNLPTESAADGDLRPPAAAAWDTCTATGRPTYDTDGTTCLDRDAVRCAGALYRHALRHNGGTDHLLGYLDQVREESNMSAAVGTESVIDALFAYKDAAGAEVWRAESAHLSDAQALFQRPLTVMYAPGFVHALAGLGKAVVREERFGADLQQMLDIGARSVETWVTELRLQQRTDPSDPLSSRRRLAYATAWAHLQGVLMRQIADRFEVPESFAQVSLIAESAALLSTMASQIGSDKNPFGFSHDYVPLRLASVGEDGSRTTNYELIRTDADLQIDFYEEQLANAEDALAVFAQNEYDIVSQTAQVLARYNNQLVRLCGELPGGGPDVEHCGQVAGEIRERVVEIQLAGQRIESAQLALIGNSNRIAVEEDRIREVLLNTADLEVTLNDLQDDIFVVEDDASAKVGALRATRRGAQCGFAFGNAAVDAAVAATEGATGSAAALAKVPPDPSGAGAAVAVAAAKATAAFAKAGLGCAEAAVLAGIDSDISSIQRAAARDITLINGEMDAAIRASSAEEKAINSAAVVQNLLIDAMELSLDVERAGLEAELASARLNTALVQVASLVASRGRALAILETDPDNPFTNARFLRLRLELGRHVARWRDLALRAAYRAGRALELEMNRDVTFIESRLLPARSETELSEFLFCIDSAFQGYRQRFAEVGSQELVSVVSVRDEVFGLSEPVFDRVAGRDVSPAEQFREILTSPDNTVRDGTIVLKFALPLSGSVVIADTQCDNRIEAIEVQLVGDSLGDDEAGVVINRDGRSHLRRCDSKDQSYEQAVTSYSLDLQAVGIQARTSNWSDDESGKSFGYAGWPLSGDQWQIEIPNGDTDPRNADFDIRSVDDILLRITSRAGTVSASGDGFVPTCG